MPRLNNKKRMSMKKKIRRRVSKKSYKKRSSKGGGKGCCRTYSVNRQHTTWQRSSKHACVDKVNKHGEVVLIRNWEQPCRGRNGKGTL